MPCLLSNVVKVKSYCKMDNRRTVQDQQTPLLRKKSIYQEHMRQQINNKNVRRLTDS